MGPRLGFVLSLLAACGIHAVVLLVPRAAIVEEVPVPTVELDLTTAPAFAEAAPAVMRAIAPRAVPRRPVRETPPDSAGPRPPEAATSAVPAEPAASAPSNEQSVSSFPVNPEQAGAAGSDGAPAGPTPGNTDAAGDAATSPSEGAADTTSAAAAVSVSLLIPPRPRAEILPLYPRSARRSGLEGMVKVSAMVDVSGAVTSAEVLASSGHELLDQAALDAVRRAVFAPALREGKPVPCRIVIPIRFQLSAPSP